MYNQDDQLEEALNRAVLDQESQQGAQHAIADDDQIASLVNLAASIRELPHPDRSAGTVHAEKRRIMSAAQGKNQVKRRSFWSRNGGFTGQWMVLPAIAGAALLVLMVFILAVSAGVYFAGPRGAQAHAVPFQPSQGGQPAGPHFHRGMRQDRNESWRLPT